MSIFPRFDSPVDRLDQRGCFRREGLAQLLCFLDVSLGSFMVIRDRGLQCVQDLTELKIVDVVPITRRASLGSIIESAFGIARVIAGDLFSPSEMNIRLRFLARSSEESRRKRKM